MAIKLSRHSESGYYDVHSFVLDQLKYELDYIILFQSNLKTAGYINGIVLYDASCRLNLIGNKNILFYFNYWLSKTSNIAITF